ncbi:MAG: hypothetical protein OXG55_15205 [bacterium]|nr:hypothetical protein [bacterium]MCY3951229.1 hypothetical protein [bacterium]MCY4104585.1 hypothetical protein [bacterium]
MQIPLVTVPPAPASGTNAPAPPDAAGQPRAQRSASNGRTGAVELWVEPWNDLGPDAGRGHHPRSPYVELFWLGVLGPSATWLIRRLALRLEETPSGVLVNTAEIAGEIGLGGRQALLSAFQRAFERCCRFGLMQRGRHNTLFVRTRLPDLTARMAERLPPGLRVAHDVWRRHPASDPTEIETLGRARHLAMALLACGDEPDEVERQLHIWQFHPAVAFEAANWATEQHARAAAAVSAVDADTAEPTAGVAD